MNAPNAAYVTAAQAAIDAAMASARIDPDGSDSVALFHTLIALIEWSDARGVDFDAEVSNARDELSAA